MLHRLCIGYAYSLCIQCVLIMSSALEFIAGVTCMACAVMYYPDINAVMINEWGLSKGFDISLRSLILDQAVSSNENELFLTESF